MWKSKLFNLGTVLAGKKYLCVFEYVNDRLPDSVSIRSSCGCTNEQWNKEQKKLYVNIKLNPIPNHLSDVGKYDINKRIYFRYKIDEEEKEDVLMIIGFAVKNL
jgi:hypothetical protein